MCVPVGKNVMCVQLPQRLEEGCRLHETRVTDNFRPTKMGAEKQPCVLWQSGECP